MHFTFTFLLLLLLTMGKTFSQCNQPIWSDEFEGSTLNLSKWAFQTGNGCPNLCGWGNNELEYYTNSNKNLYIKDGVLVIEARKESLNGSAFTSSKLITLGLASWTYGRFEARMRMPLGNGLWPAFWMLSTLNNWPTTGEIDIMEYRGDKPKETNSTLHYGSAWPNNQYDPSSYSTSQSLSDDFHLYSVEWEENEIRFYYDQTLIKKETRYPNSLKPASNNNPWPWTSNFYIILNLAVGGNYTGNPNAEQVQMTKPTFEIDYVRVYELPCTVTSIASPLIDENQLKIYPHPVAHFLQVELPSSIELSEVTVKDIKGTSVKRTTINSKGEIDLSDVTAGVYFLVFQTTENLITRKIVKQ